MKTEKQTFPEPSQEPVARIDSGTLAVFTQVRDMLHFAFELGALDDDTIKELTVDPWGLFNDFNAAVNRMASDHHAPTRSRDEVVERISEAMMDCWRSKKFTTHEDLKEILRSELATLRD